VIAVVTRLPENHALASDRIESNLFSCTTLRGADDDAGIGHNNVCLWVSVEKSSELEIGHHLHDLAIVNHSAVPLHAVRGAAKVAPNLPLSHATHELVPRGLIVATELYTRLGGVVEEFIVLNPEGDVPGFVVSPTVVGKCHGRLGCLN